MFWADDDRNQGSIHTNFKLSKSGEYIGIFDDEGSDFEIIDKIEFGNQSSDTSYGRLPNGTGDFVSLLPSPGAPNLITSTQETAIQNNRIEVYPNPMNDVLFFDSRETIQSITVFNSVGQAVDFQLKEHNALELPDIQGLYFIRFTSVDNASTIKKVIRR